MKTLKLILSAVLFLCATSNAYALTILTPPPDWQGGRIIVGKKVSGGSLPNGVAVVIYEYGYSGVGGCVVHQIGSTTSLNDTKYKILGSDFVEEVVVQAETPPTTSWCGTPYVIGKITAWGSGKIEIYTYGGDDVADGGNSTHVTVGLGQGNDLVMLDDIYNVYGGEGDDWIIGFFPDSTYMYGGDGVGAIDGDDKFCVYDNQPNLINGELGTDNRFGSADSIVSVENNTLTMTQCNQKRDIIFNILTD